MSEKKVDKLFNILIANVTMCRYVERSLSSNTKMMKNDNENSKVLKIDGFCA